MCAFEVRPTDPARPEAGEWNRLRCSQILFESAFHAETRRISEKIELWHVERLSSRVLRSPLSRARPLACASKNILLIFLSNSSRSTTGFVLCLPTMHHKILKARVVREPLIFGGESEIRTHEPLARLPVFKTGAFGHSAISPLGSKFFRSKSGRIDFALRRSGLVSRDLDRTILY